MRKSGRTFRILLKACLAASEGKPVIVVTNSQGEANRLRDSASVMAMFANGQREGYYRLTIAGTPIDFRHMDWYKNNHRGIPRDTIVVFDNSTYTNIETP